jgi:hypothetical protein
MKELFDQLTRNNEKLGKIMQAINTAKNKEAIERIEADIDRIMTINSVVLEILKQPCHNRNDLVQ